MRLLIDSHALIWFINGDSQLSVKARGVIPDFQIERFVSAATLWEMAIKINLGKLHISKPLSSLPSFLAAHDIQLLPVNFEHILGCSTLPLFHRDPFDRMLVAQALTENLTVVTKDPNIPLYGVEVVW